MAVHWSDAAAIDDDGTERRPKSVTVNYQSMADGGCSNTSSDVDPTGITQRTTVPRTTPQGSVVRLP